MSQLLQAPLEELKSRWIDYLSSVVSGIIDGFVLGRYPQWWILKNVALAVAGLFVRQIPDGFKFHSFGQLGFILMLYFLMGG